MAKKQKKDSKQAKPKTISFRPTKELEEKLSQTVEMLTNSGKLDPKSAQSDFIRTVLNGACDEILQTPVGEIASMIEEKKPKLRIFCIYMPKCKDRGIKCETCEHAIKEDHYYKKKVVKKEEEEEHEQE